MLDRSAEELRNKLLGMTDEAVADSSRDAGLSLFTLFTVVSYQEVSQFISVKSSLLRKTLLTLLFGATARKHLISLWIDGVRLDGSEELVY